MKNSYFLVNDIGSILATGVRENFVALVMASLLLGLSIRVAVKQHRKRKETAVKETK